MEYDNFWSSYYDITAQLKKRYIFKRTPFAEAKEKYQILLSDSKRLPPEYAAQCELRLAR